MKELRQLFENNQAWVTKMTSDDPDFFQRLVGQQSPQYLWIGCSDSRVPANEIVDLLPGEMFVHRNIANVVVHTDLNCLSVLQYAVDVLKVRHVIVCGHYGCGGIRAALENAKLGLIDNWLRHIQDVAHKHHQFLDSLSETNEDRPRTLCELNVIEQVLNVAQTTVIQDAWNREQRVTIHGWVYGLSDGKLRDLGLTVAENASLTPSYNQVISNYMVA